MGDEKRKDGKPIPGSNFIAHGFSDAEVRILALHWFKCDVHQIDGFDLNHKGCPLCASEKEVK